MLKINTTTSKTFQWALALGLIAAASANGVNGAEIHGSCGSPVPVLANETLRSDGAGPGQDRCFVINLATPGILTFDVSAPGAERANARLDFLGPADGARSERKVFEYVKRSAASVTLAVKAGGSYLVRVSAEDRRLGLPPYKLRAGFGEQGGFALNGEYDEELEPDPDPLGLPPLNGEYDEELEPDPDPLGLPPLNGEYDEELEPDPDPLVSCRVFVESGTPLNGEYDEELEPDPDPLVGAPLNGEYDEELEPDPDPLIFRTSAHDLSAASAALRSELDGLCRAGEVDDHGDSFACATVLRPGCSATGEIHNGWGDDEDVYRFRLAEPRTVEVTSGGFTDTTGELYDRYGNQLDRDDGGRDGNFRLVRSLSPGVYFVRVNGRDADQGTYSLAVTALR